MICAPFCRRWETQTLAAVCGLHRVQLPGPGHISLSSILSRKLDSILSINSSGKRKYILAETLDIDEKVSSPEVLVSAALASSLSCIF